MHAPGTNDVGLKLVIAYKTVKGAVELALSIMLVAAVAGGLADMLQEFAIGLRLHVTRAWSFTVAEFLFNAATRDNLQLVSLALGMDGLLTFIEGWGLHLRKRWAPWLVVLASGFLLPFEVLELSHGVSLGRVLVLLVNLAIVAYMASRVIREHATHGTHA